MERHGFAQIYALIEMAVDIFFIFIPVASGKVDKSSFVFVACFIAASAGNGILVPGLFIFVKAGDSSLQVFFEIVKVRVASIYFVQIDVDFHVGEVGD